MPKQSPESSTNAEGTAAEKRLAPVLSNGGEQEHAGRQTGAGTSLPLVRRSPGGENTVSSGTRARMPPPIRDLKQLASMPET